MKPDSNVRKLALAGIIAALSFAGFMFFPSINTFGLKIHLGNVFVVLGSLFLGGVWGGLAGAVGLTIADILGGYAATAPITFLCKLIIGLITGLVAHKCAHISDVHPQPYIVKWTILASIAGLGCNCITDPVLNYLWQRLIFPGAEALLSINIAITGINAVINSILAVILYSALRPALRRMHFF